MRPHFCSVIDKYGARKPAMLFYLVYPSPMRSIFHTLLIWLMLLAVPVQGFAAASRVLCGPMTAPAVAVTQLHHHDHAEMSANGESMQAQHHQPQQHDQSHHQQNSNDHAQGKCGACASCCIGASISAPANVRMPAMHVDSQRIVAFESFPTSIVLDYPDRPPQATFI